MNYHTMGSHTNQYDGIARHISILNKVDSTETEQSSGAASICFTITPYFLHSARLSTIKSIFKCAYDKRLNAFRIKCIVIHMKIS